MRYTTMGFNQEKAVELGLDLTDLCILKWIQEALARPKMSKIQEEDDIYVWMDYTTFIKDYPILKIQKSALTKRTTALVEKGVILRKRIANKGNKGSRSYFTLTELFETLVYKNSDIEELPSVKNSTCKTTKCKKIYLKTRPSVKNSTSDLLTNNTYNNTITNSNSNIEFFGTLPKSTETKKDNLYSKCISIVNDFTDDEDIKSLLVQYLNLLLEMKKIRGVNQWKGMVNNTLVKSLNESDKGITYEDIIQYSIDHAYATFYPRKLNYSRNSNFMNKSQNVPYPEGRKQETDVEQWKREIEEREKNGKRTKF